MKRLTPLLFVASGLVGSLILTLLVFGLPLGDSLRMLADGAFSDKFGVARTLVKATPLVLTGLGMVVAWRAGMFNIGGEGQFIMGSLFGATIYKLMPSAPSGVLNVLMLLACLIGGAMYAALPAWLEIKRGVNVVITTILLNFVALQLLGWAVAGPLQENARSLPQTQLIPNAVMLQRFDRQTDLHSGVFLALAAVFVIQAWLMLSRGGFRLRVVGENPRAARANKIRPDRERWIAMIVSGALCGLAGGVEYTGIAGQLATSSSQNWGFLAIPVALLGGLNPLGTLASGLYFGALFAGSQNLARFSAAGSTLVYVIQAVAVLAYVVFLSLSERRTLKGEAA